MTQGTIEMLRDGGYQMSPTASTLLWFFLANMIRDPNSQWDRHVNIYMTSMRMLTVATCRSESSIRSALAELEHLGFIYKTPRVRSDGSDTNPDIEMTTPGDFCFSCRKRGHADGVCINPPARTRGRTHRN